MLVTTYKVVLLLCICQLATSSVQVSNTDITALAFDDAHSNIFAGDQHGFLSRVTVNNKQMYWNSSINLVYERSISAIQTYDDQTVVAATTYGWIYTVNTANITLELINKTLLSIATHCVVGDPTSNTIIVGVVNGTVLHLNKNTLVIEHVSHLNVTINTCTYLPNFPGIAIGSNRSVSVYDTEQFAIVSHFTADFGFFDRSTLAGSLVFLWDSDPSYHENINQNKVPIIAVSREVIGIAYYSEEANLCTNVISNAWFSADGTQSVWNEFCPYEQMILFGEDFTPNSIFLQIPILSPGFTSATALAGVANPTDNALYLAYNSGVIQDLYFLNGTYGASTASSLPFGPVWSTQGLQASLSSYKRDFGSVSLLVTNSSGSQLGNSIYLFNLEEFETLCATLPSETTQPAFTFSSDVSTFYYFTNSTYDILTLYSIPLKNVTGEKWLTPPTCPTSVVLQLNGTIAVELNSYFDVLIGVFYFNNSFQLFRYNLTSLNYTSTPIKGFNPIMPFSFDPSYSYFVYVSTTGPTQQLNSVSTATFASQNAETSIDRMTTMYVDSQYVYVCTLTAVTKYYISPLMSADSSAITQALVFEEKIYSYSAAQGVGTISVYDVNFISLGTFTFNSLNINPNYISIETYFDYTIFYFNNNPSALVIGDQHYNIQNSQSLTNWNELYGSYYFFAGVAYAVSPVEIATLSPAYLQLKRLRVCPLGHVAFDNQCFKCPPGQFSGNFIGSFSCQNCPNNMISTYGSISCSYCPEGHIPHPVIRSQCLPCGAGSYAFPGNLTCSPCEPGSFSNVSGVASCQLCPTGTFSNETFALSCTPCMPGTHMDAMGATACTSCIPGFFSNTTKTVNCTACPPGYSAHDSASMSCAQCRVGTYSNSTGIVNCLVCPYGSFTNETGTIDCEMCPQDMFCSVASTMPIPASLYDDYVVSAQTSDIGTQYISAVKVSLLAAAPLLLILLIIFLCWGCNNNTKSVCDRVIKRLDLFFTLNHFVPQRSAPIKRRTKLGGIFTILVFFTVTLILVYSVYNHIFFNTIRTTSFYPQYFPHAMTAEDMTVHIALVGVTSAECNTTTIVSSLSGSYTYWSNFTNDYICNFTMHFSSCTFEGREQGINVQFIGSPFFSAPIITWNVTMKYIFQNSYSILYGSINAPLGSVFKGSSPTEVEINMTPVIYKTDNVQQLYGITPIFYSSTLGSSVTAESFYDATDVVVSLSFDRNTAVLDISDVKLMSMASLVAGITSLSMGVLGFFRVLLPMIEEYVIMKIQKRIKTSRYNTLQSETESLILNK